MTNDQTQLTARHGFGFSPSMLNFLSMGSIIASILKPREQAYLHAKVQERRFSLFPAVLFLSVLNHLI